MGIGIKECADAFLELQAASHAADYDPLFRSTMAKAVTLVGRAQEAVGNPRAASPRDRRAFAVLVLVRKRSYG